MKTTKSIILLLIIITLYSCGKNKLDCEFSHLSITTMLDGKKMNEKVDKDCYSIRKERVERFVVEGKQTSNKLSIKYVENSKVNLKNMQVSPLKILDLTIDGKKTEWTSNNGHTIMKAKSQDSLLFMCVGDNKAITRILFTK